MQPSRSWFVVWDRPQEHVTYMFDSENRLVRDENNDPVVIESVPSEFAGLSPEELCDRVLNMWCSVSDTRAGAVTYCLSARGMPHLHMVLEDEKPFRFHQVKLVYPSAHIVPTRGSKKQAEDYIYKLGKWSEQGEKVIAMKIHGEIKGAQGKRSDLDQIEQLISDGVHPNEILLQNFRYERYEEMIKKHYYRQKMAVAPVEREVRVYWHVGLPGCGKTGIFHQLDEEFPNDVFGVFQYENGFLDYYLGEKILLLDEFRGQIRYSVLLTMLQGYRARFHARFNDIVGLWEEVHITSVYAPEVLYRKMVDYHDRDIDSIDQLMRRLTEIHYHYLDAQKKFQVYKMAAKDYTNYNALVAAAAGDASSEFVNLTAVDMDYVKEFLW